MKLLKKLPILILSLSVVVISILAIAKPGFASRHTHPLIAEWMPIIPAKIAWVAPQISQNNRVKQPVSLNQISATLASTWTTNHNNASIPGCNCPQCQLAV
ncbi:hypothetical protein [Planktothrix sp.]|uniref:hypothetical protein n=1 Tax=Planktothrix sp. TaxID=3088171 RepID=UPI0038D3C5DC